MHSRIAVLQTAALLLGYQALERETGIGPATFSLARRRSTDELLSHVEFLFKMYHIIFTMFGKYFIVLE